MKSLDIQNLIKSGLFAYGSSMTAENFGLLDSIVSPIFTGLTRQQEISAIRTYDLKLLGLYGQVNEQLLAVGRKLIRSGDDYVIPPQSEMMDYVSAYYRQADSKHRKGIKLYTNFTRLYPHHSIPPSISAAHMKAHSLKEQAESKDGPAC